MSFSGDYFWEAVSGTHEKTAHTASLTHGKVAAAQFWPFLAGANSEAEFADRLSIVSERIEASVGPDVYDDVVSSLYDDFRTLHEGSEKVATQKTAWNLSSLNDGEEAEAAGHKITYYSEQAMGDNNQPARGYTTGQFVVEHPGHSARTFRHSPYKPNSWAGEAKRFAADQAISDAHSCTRCGSSTSKESSVKEAFYSHLVVGQHPEGGDAIHHYAENEGEAHAFADHLRNNGMQADVRPNRPSMHEPRAVTATNYQPDPAQAWRYHQEYEQLRQPVNNGALQDADGFPIDLAQGEDRSQPILENQASPAGQWHDTPGTAMPERPMPFSQQRGYQPVASTRQKGNDLYEQGYAHGHAGKKPFSHTRVAPSGEKYGDYLEGHRDGKSDREVEDVMGYPPSKVSSLFDTDGFLVEAADVNEPQAGTGGRANNPLVDPPVGAPLRVNPYYFNTEEAAMGSNEGFPQEPTVDPDDRMNEIYGEGVTPQVSSGSDEGTIDGKGYSRSHPGESPNFSQGKLAYGPTDKDYRRLDQLNEGRTDGPTAADLVNDHDPRKRVDDDEDNPWVKGYNEAYERSLERQSSWVQPAAEWAAGIGAGTLPVTIGPAIDLAEKAVGARDKRVGYEAGHSDGFHQRKPTLRDGHGPYTHVYNKHYQLGYQHGNELRDTSLPDHQASNTDGKIVGQCPGCSQPLRKHQTAHGDELHHLHNDHVRCHGSKQNRSVNKERPAGFHALNWRDWQNAPTVDPYGEGLIHPEQRKDDFGKNLTNRAALDHGSNVEGWDRPPTFAEALEYNSGYGIANSWEYMASLAAAEDAQLSNGSVHTADYLGRPDASNPTGRGQDEYQARNWDAYTRTRPFQSPEDRGINTPQLPQEPMQTSNVNTPTPGLKDGLQVTRDEDREDDEDED